MTAPPTRTTTGPERVADGARFVRARYAAALRSPPPLWTLAAVLVLGETLLALAGAHSVALSLLALLAPGWALVPLLPRPLRASPLVAFAAGPALGFATVSVVLITIARIGVHLSGASVRIALIALIVLALPTWSAREEVRWRPTREGALEALGLLGAIALGLVLSLRVVGLGVAPGNDWAKYLLYAEQIQLHGSILINNPFWMLGQPFRDDPGVPALYGATLILSRGPASVLRHGIVLFALLEVVTLYAFARAFWGRAAGVLAAALVAVVPASQDILGWHGLANLAALALLALLFAYLASFTGARGHEAAAPAGATRDDEPALDRRALVGFALTLLALLASHRLSGVIGLAVTGLVVLACLISPSRRRRALRDAIWLAGLTIVLGAGVLADLYSRETTFGGSLPYTDYLNTKVNLSLALRDVSPMLAGAVAVALVVAAIRHRREGALWAPVALAAVVVALAYVWILHVPNYYQRMVFYVPLAAAPLIAAVAVRLPGRWLVAGAAAIGIALTTISSYTEAGNIRTYYSFVTPAALRGLDALSAVLRPDEVVVTDRCWSFLSTWLLHTRTLAALEPQDIQPGAELPFAREAQQILDGSSYGLARARALGVRYLVVDPVCPGANGSQLPPPRVGTPVYESSQLAILRLPA